MIKVTLLVMAVSFAAEAQVEKVTPLFRNDTMVTQVSIPFLLLDTSNQPLNITRLNVTSTAGKCKGFVDPYIQSNFFIKCSEPDSARAEVFFSRNGQIVKLNYGPVTVTAISDRPVVTPLPPDPPPPDYTEGRMLFERIVNNKSCAGCHSDRVRFANVKFENIKSAIATKPPMQDLTYITDAQIQAIVAYLNNQ